MSDTGFILYCSNCHAGNVYEHLDYNNQCRNCNTVPRTWHLEPPPDLGAAADIGD